jgi:hypothetical protein
MGALFVINFTSFDVKFTTFRIRDQQKKPYSFPLGALCALARAIPLIQPDYTRKRNLLEPLDNVKK